MGFEVAVGVFVGVGGSFLVVGLLVEKRGSPPGALPMWRRTVALGSGLAVARATSSNASVS